LSGLAVTVTTSGTLSVTLGLLQTFQAILHHFRETLWCVNKVTINSVTCQHRELRLLQQRKCRLWCFGLWSCRFCRWLQTFWRDKLPSSYKTLVTTYKTTVLLPPTPHSIC
jgi:hypothetical protein